METVVYVQKQLAAAKRQFDGVMQETTEEQINWKPGGTANTIGVTLVHLANTLDNSFQKVLQDRPSLWEKEGWGEKLGLSGPPGRVNGWDEIKSKHLALEPVSGYAAAAFKQAEDFVAGLKAEDLERIVIMYGNERPLAEVLVMQFTHTVVHTGEIAALKGMQGVKGLPV